MTPEEREAFLRDPHVAVVATEQPDGRPHLTPLWYSWDGASFTLATPTTSAKYRNVRARPRVTICVDKKSWPYRSVIAECDAEIAEHRAGYPPELAARYLEGERLQALLDRYAPIEWAVITARPTRWYGHINRSAEA